MPDAPPGAASRPLRIVAAGFAVSLVVCTALSHRAPAAAARPPANEDASEELAVDLHIERPWFGPDDPLSLEVRLRNRTGRTLSDLRIGVTVFTRARSRSELEAAFEGRLPFSPLEAFTIPADDLSPEGSRSVRIDERLEELGALADAPEGVYPLEVAVHRSPPDPTMERVVTALPLHQQSPPVPLRLVPVVSVAPRPLTGPDGAPVENLAERLERLHRTLTHASDETPGASLAVAPHLPAELERLGDRPEGEAATALLEALRTASERSPLLLHPATPALLPHLDALDRDPALEIQRGHEQLQDSLGVAPIPVLYPPGLVLDGASLERAAGEIRAAVARGTHLEPDARLTPSQPVRAEDVALLPADGPLADDIVSARTGLDVSRAAAQSAMLFFESPGRRRTVAVDVDAGARGAAAFIAAVSDAPWIEIIDPLEALHPEPRTRDPRFPTVAPPPADFQRFLRRAEVETGRFAAYTLDDNPLRTPLEAAVEAGYGTAWWHEDWREGRAWLRATLETLARERDHLGVTGEAVTFTSRSGEVPVTLVNRADYPARVRVEVDSPKLRFPEGNTRVIQLDPPGDTLTFPALADATGTFPVLISVTSPDRRVLLAEEELLVRSTAANLLALLLTLGAATFLVATYGRRMMVSRRRARSPEPPDPPASRP